MSSVRERFPNGRWLLAPDGSEMSAIQCRVLNRNWQVVTRLAHERRYVVQSSAGLRRDDISGIPMFPYRILVAGFGAALPRLIRHLIQCDRLPLERGSSSSRWRFSIANVAGKWGVGSNMVTALNQIL